MLDEEVVRGSIITKADGGATLSTKVARTIRQTKTTKQRKLNELYGYSLYNYPSLSRCTCYH